MADFSYKLDKRLIVIKAIFQGRQGKCDTDLILDTGASLTILDPFVIKELGYSEKDQSAPSTVQSPVGREKGFKIRLPLIECFDKKIENFEVACHALGLQNIGGLLGMNFLEQFDFCIHPQQCVIRI
ncbi:MAG: retropepsin-like aspartic protease [Deltaproteobacteria bacterium]|nr:retropepsin-like aspartic protease [Deltaproteobacteria bacterium]